MRAKSYAGYRLTARRPASSAAVEHWWAEGPDGPAEVYLGPEMLVRRARALPIWGPFSPILTGREGLRSYVVVRGRLGRTVDDLRGMLSPGACVAFAWHLAAALAEVHERGGAHGAMHPGWTGVDTEGRLTIRPALTAAVRSDPDAEATAQSTDCIQLASVLEALELERLDEPSLSLLMRGVSRDRSRLRLQPGRAVRQSLSYILHRHPEWEASLVETLGDDWRTSLLPRAVPLPGPETPVHPWVDHATHIPRVGGPHQGAAAAMVDVRAVSAVPMERSVAIERSPPPTVAVPVAVPAAAGPGAAALVDVELPPEPAHPSVRVHVTRAASPEPDHPASAESATEAAESVGVSVDTLAAPLDSRPSPFEPAQPAPAVPEALPPEASVPAQSVENDVSGVILASAEAVLPAMVADVQVDSDESEESMAAVDPPSVDSPTPDSPEGAAEETPAVEPSAPVTLTPHEAPEDAPTSDSEGPAESDIHDDGEFDPAYGVVESPTDLAPAPSALAALLADSTRPRPEPRPFDSGAPVRSMVIGAEDDSDPDSDDPAEVFEDDEKTAVESVPEPVRQALAHLESERGSRNLARLQPETDAAGLAPPSEPRATADRSMPTGPAHHPVDDDDEPDDTAAPRWAGLKGVTGDVSREDELGSGKWEEEARPLDELRREMGATPVREMESIDPSRGSWPMLVVALVALVGLVVLWFVTQGGG